MALKNLRGRVALILPEEDFDVDQIVGISNISIQDPEALGRLALDWCGPEFAANHRPGDLIIGARNFGYGHPHDPPMIGMRHLGMAGVIAESFSPYYWLAENFQGFPQVPCPGILRSVRLWDDLEVDWNAGVVRNLTQGSHLNFEPLTRSEMATLDAGGLPAYLKMQIQTRTPTSG